MHFVLYQDRKKEWRWRLVARNGAIIADSAEGYRRPGRAKAMARKITLGVYRAGIRDIKGHWLPW